MGLAVGRQSPSAHRCGWLGNSLKTYHQKFWDIYNRNTWRLNTGKAANIHTVATNPICFRNRARIYRIGLPSGFISEAVKFDHWPCTFNLERGRGALEVKRHPVQGSFDQCVRVKKEERLALG